MNTTSSQSAIQKLAGRLSNTFLFNQARALWDENSRNWNLPLSKQQKLAVGIYLILKDYSKGIFPPQYHDREKAYQAEIDYPKTLPNTTPDSVALSNMQKPFWDAAAMKRYVNEFCRICHQLEQCGVRPPAKVMELGCGHGWTSEFLAAMGYEVMGTSIVSEDIDWAQKRVASLKAKGLERILDFKSSPMESVARDVGPKSYYDAVFIYEALHHAFDWREAIASASECLKPGGWLLLCNEPNLVHTFSSYRVARLSNTHEIGMSRKQLTAHMRKCGLGKTMDFGSRLHFWLRPHWLAGQKTA